MQHVHCCRISPRLTREYVPQSNDCHSVDCLHHPSVLNDTRARRTSSPVPTQIRLDPPGIVPHIDSSGSGARRRGPPVALDVVGTALVLATRKVTMKTHGWAPPLPLFPLVLVLGTVGMAHIAPAMAHCLARLDTHPAEFDVCKRGGTHCFLFLAEPPMVFVDGATGAATPTDGDAPPGIRSPFPCAEAARLHGVAGASFDLHGAHGLWPSNTDLCVYAGSPEECTFTAMVAYLLNVKIPSHPAFGMALGTAGMLVQVEKRLPQAIPSIPIYEVRTVSTVAAPESQC